MTKRYIAEMFINFQLLYSTFLLDNISYWKIRAKWKYFKYSLEIYVKLFKEFHPIELNKKSIRL